MAKAPSTAIFETLVLQNRASEPFSRDYVMGAEP